MPLPLVDCGSDSAAKTRGSFQAGETGSSECAEHGSPARRGHRLSLSFGLELIVLQPCTRYTSKLTAIIFGMIKVPSPPTALRLSRVYRSADGSKFSILGTDLKGSRELLICESTDLVNWGEPALREVVGPTAGNASAPEAAGAYDGSNSYIDTTFLKAQDSTLYRFTKNENSVSDTDPNGKMVFQDVSNNGSPDGSFTRIVNAIGKGSISAGEGPTAFADMYWLFIDEFGGRGYVPFFTTDIASGTWTLATDYTMPSNKARHGTVIPVTQTQFDTLRVLI